MKALFPAFCRPLGYVILLISVFLPFILVLTGSVTDASLVFYKEGFKLQMILGAIFILFALSKYESMEVQKIRSTAMRNALFLTVAFIFVSMFSKVLRGASLEQTNSYFLLFLILDVLSLEFGMKKAQAEKMFKK